MLMGWYVGSVCMQSYELNILFLDTFLTTMGARLPLAAIPHLFDLEKKVVVVCGNGGFMLNFQPGF